ncbi:hypothetical protein PISMIDRAFT_679901, partial [Pisolithus microcarpus 441]
MDCQCAWYAQAGRCLSIGASFLSGLHIHTSSSQANTPPLTDGFAETASYRCEIS